MPLLRAAGCGLRCALCTGDWSTGGPGEKLRRTGYGVACRMGPHGAAWGRMGMGLAWAMHGATSGPAWGLAWGPSKINPPGGGGGGRPAAPAGVPAEHPYAWGRMGLARGRMGSHGVSSIWGHMGPHGVGMGLAWGWHAGVGMGLSWGWHGAVGLAWS
jgi:hypothetical protein